MLSHSLFVNQSQTVGAVHHKNGKLCEMRTLGKYGDC